MYTLLEQAKTQTNRKTTNKTYEKIWVKFNKFLIRLDRLPRLWEHRIALYCVYLMHSGLKSATLKTYVSAIKYYLKLDDYDCDHGKILLSTLTRVCKINNDVVRTRLPIQKGLLELALFRITQMFYNQVYLQSLYMTIFVVAYYGLFRVSELVGVHAVKAADIHAGENKDKYLLVLYFIQNTR